MTLGLSPEEIIARNKAAQKAWRAAHPERMREFHRKNNQKTETKARKAAWAVVNRDVILERARARRAEQRRAAVAPEPQLGSAGEEVAFAG